MSDTTDSIEATQRRAACPSSCEGPSAPAGARGGGWRLHRRMYDWVLSWADTPFGAWALFIMSFAESSFFPIPPDVLLMPLVLGNRSKWLRFAFLCTAASALGGVLGYAIGMGFMDTIGARIIAFYHAEEYYAKVTEWYRLYDFWIVFIAALTPIPYKVFTIASGAFHMNLPAFFLVSLVGRGIRFFAVAGLLYLFGPPMKRLIEKYFDLLCILFVVLLIGGFAVIKLLK